MKWEHQCRLEWMKERQRHLTASDVKSLIPFTKTGRAKKITEMDYLRVLSSKIATLTIEDCFSSGAAARGHILEPYAIDAFNEFMEDHAAGPAPRHLFHWDDIVVPKDYKQTWGLAFSPDALSNLMSMEAIESCVCNKPGATILGEVKCYGHERHLTTAYTPKDELEERWQIATALACDPELAEAFLILFDPGIDIQQLVMFHWDRSELEDEIEVVLEVEDGWLKFMSSVSRRLPSAVWGNSELNEEKIIAEILERERLNP